MSIHALYTAILIIGCSSPPPPAEAANAAASDQPRGKYPLVYEVSDQTRSVMRSVREQIGLIQQYMQFLGCSGEQTQRILEVVRVWVEPRREELAGIRDDHSAARFKFLNGKGRVFSLEQRLEALESRLPAEQDLCDRLAAEFARRMKELPELQAQFARIDREYGLLLDPLVADVNKKLTPLQQTQWAAAKHNIAQALPMETWFVPGISEEQVRRIRQGQPPAQVLDERQREVSAAAMSNYKSFRQTVADAEYEFFYGSAAGSAPAAAQLPAECPFHAEARPSATP